MMGLVKLPTFSDYWSNVMHYPAIASNMPSNRFKVLCQNFNFVDNLSFSEGNGKVFKISPVIGAVRNRCLKVECKMYHAVDEQIIPSKTKYTKIRQHNPKKLCKWGFKNMAQAGKSGFMYDFYLYCGNENRSPANHNHLRASAQFVARLCSKTPRHADICVPFDNWFATLALLLYLKNIGLHAVGTSRASRLQGCPLIPVKDLKKQERGAVDSLVDNNSGLVTVRWLQNRVV